MLKSDASSAISGSSFDFGRIQQILNGQAIICGTEIQRSCKAESNQTLPPKGIRQMIPGIHPDRNPMNRCVPRFEPQSTPASPQPLKASLFFARRSCGRAGIRSLMFLLLGAVVPAVFVSAAQAQEASTSAPAVLADHSAPADVPAWARDKEGNLVSPHDEHVTPSTPPPPGLYVSLGDSITYGYGVAQNCHAFPTHPVDIASYCPDGTSYAILVAKALRDAGTAGHFMNLGINGASVDRVISDEFSYLPADATLVTLYIGTNDSRAVRDPKNSIDMVVQKHESHYEQLLQMIHERAQQCAVACSRAGRFGYSTKTLQD
jgi:hypothetical protein